MLGLAAALPAQELHNVQNPALNEISGLTRSQRDRSILWAHNDSFNTAVLFRVGLKGEDLGTVQLAGGSLVDWEDIASFTWRGQPALLLADTGDNFGFRDHLTLYAVSDPGRGDAAGLLWALDFRYPDGARDCEAVAVDAQRGEILLLSKHDHPPRLYRLPLPAATSPAGTSEKTLTPPALVPGTARGIQTAEFLGAVTSIPPPTREERKRKGYFAGDHLEDPTALDISADGRRAVIVTYQAAYLYARARGQSWLEALNRAPRIIPLPPFEQIEAGTISADGRWLYVASEGRPIGFARLAVPR
jgi:hypothetical protein